ncbi:ferrichrome outer membrane transporter [Klebsiella grimontii]|uniref:Ferrichrome outer membrane transporter n=1 Tax=Klebsiella grimontii TaxID=2058152 RepID=A0A7H4P9Z0_9ENTR|nr:ferrichrome outer membrane transporter [Klebsiella grimontii]
MARLKTAQPNHSLRKIAAVVATAVSGMSVYAQAAVEPKEETITVTAAPAPQESAWGPAATIAAKHSATATKTDTPIEKNAAVYFRSDPPGNGDEAADDG